VARILVDGTSMKPLRNQIYNKRPNVWSAVIGSVTNLRLASTDVRVSASFTFVWRIWGPRSQSRSGQLSDSLSATNPRTEYLPSGAGLTFSSVSLDLNIRGGYSMALEAQKMKRLGLTRWPLPEGYTNTKTNPTTGVAHILQRFQ
jgi:hypothetical protein